jgi:hypothetical protein
MWYILDENNKPVATHAMESALWMDKNPERKAVAQEYIDDVFISTVFIGLDHKNYGWLSTKTPILWETMIFGGDHDQYQERYTSHEDALEGHKKALTLITKK